MSPRRPVDPPCRILQALEASWPWEALHFQLSPPPDRLVPVGDSRPVLVLPGFTGSDVSTAPLRGLLRRHGHWVHGWRLGHNLGPTPGTVSGLRALLDRLHERHGQPISLVGASLGGVLARALAREKPDSVAQVITLGSPFRVVDGDRTVGQPLWDKVSFMHTDELVSFDVAEEWRTPLAVPATAIYTRTDGVATWELGVEDTRPGAPNGRAENIEVYGTHTGLGVNSSVAFAILDRLALPTSAWRPFVPPPALEALYPSPASWAGERVQAVAR